MKNWIQITLLTLALVLAPLANAGVDRQLDGTTITVGSPSNVLTLPQTTDTVVARTTTDTLINKTVSGSSNTLSNIGDASLSVPYIKADGTRQLSGNWNAGSFYGQFNSVQVGSAANTINALSTIINGSGTLTLPSTTDTILGRSTTDTLANKSISGSTNTLSNIGDGSLSVSYIKADGTRAFTGDQSMGSHKLTNVTDPASAQDAATKNYVDTHSSAPSLNGGSASPQAVTAAGGITLTSIIADNFVWVVGSPGAVTVTATPSITNCTADGQHLTIEGTDATKTVTLQDNAGLAGSNLRLNGTWVGGLYSTLKLHCNITLGQWIEDSRQ